MLGLGLKIQPQASYRFALSNLLIGAGVILTFNREISSSWLYWNLADLLVIIGFMEVRAGAVLLLLGTFNRKEPAIAAAPILLSITLVTPGLPQANLFALLFGLSAGYVFIMLAFDIWRWLKDEQQNIHPVVLSWPFWFMSGVFFFSAGWAVFHWQAPVVIQADVSDLTWWVYAAFVSLVNIYLVFILFLQLIQRVQLLAEHDSLTMALNHRTFKQRAEQRITNADNTPMAMIYVDLDDFKKINDNYGHATGDSALLHFVDTVKAQMRSDDMLGRLGGEEFAMLLYNCPIQQATQIAERMRSTLAETPIMVGSEKVFLTGSFGVCDAPPNASQLAALDLADSASYEAKRLGKNCVVTKESAAL